MSGSGPSVPVLVIDDERGIRELLAYELGSRGYGVVAAADAEEGLRLFRKLEFPIVLSDVRMPGMDGTRLLAEIKALRPETEVILLTGFGTLELAVEAMKRGAYDFIQKPFNVEELAGVLARAREKRELAALVALHEASRAVHRTLELDVLVPELLGLACKVLRADAAFLAFRDEAAGLRPSIAHGDPAMAAVLEACAQRLDSGEELREAFECAAPQAEERLAGLDGLAMMKAFFAAPLSAGGRRLGLLVAARTASEVPGGSVDRRHIDIFCSQVSQALDNALAYGRLREAQERLLRAEKLGAAGLLAASVAHDLNSPLTGVQGIAQVLLADPALDARVRADLETILEQSHRCTLLVRGLLGFCRSDTARPENSSAVKLVDAVLRLLRNDLSSAGVSVVRSFPAGGTWVFADPLQLQQVFLNLAVNALHAMEGRPVRTLEVSILREGDRVLVRFKDTGHGIPAEKLRTVFEPFYSTKGEGKGTGLGLYICERIAAQNGGRIEVESREGEGALFTLDVPCGKEP